MELSRKFSKRRYFKSTIVYFLTCCMFFNTSLSVALAGPEGAQVVNGQVSFQQSSYNTTITASDKSIINYSSFDIARPEIVQFIQPGSSASVLNRILSANPTNINGTLLANGRVFFVNPAGVYIGAGARINVNQLVASGLNITNSDFINGQYNFAGGEGAVINSGDISAEKVYLIGRQVANSGSISCPAGYVVMASGDRVFLGEPGTDVVLEVDAPSLPESAGPIEGSGVLNEGTIEAAGGKIVLAAGDIYSQAISNTGSLSASFEAGEAGQIKLIADGGQVTNTGTIEASGSKGGQVVMEGSRVGQFGTVHADGTDSDGGSVDLQASEVVALSSDSLTTANAGTNGNGGEIIIWADGITRFYGNIEARGGTESGDGGFAEVSGQTLIYRGHSDLGAPVGDAGTLLLDPDTIIIAGSAAGAADGSDSPDLPADNDTTLNDGGLLGEVDIGSVHTDPFTVYESEIQGTDAHIILEAYDGISTSGDFGGDQLLIMNDRDLTLRTRNDSGDLATGIDLTSSDEGAGLEIKTQGTGSITIETGVLEAAAPQVTPITLCELNASGTGNIDIDATGEVAVNGAINSGGSLTINGSSVNLDAGLVAAGVLSGSNSSINVLSNNASIQDAIDIADSGATVMVGGGTYDEDLLINKSNLTLLSEINDSVTIQTVDGVAGTNHVGISIPSLGAGFTLGGDLDGNPDNSDDNGFTILSGTTVNRLIELVSASGVTISNNIINLTDNAVHGISVGAAGATGLTINENEFISAEINEFAIWGPLMVNMMVTDNDFTAISTSGTNAMQFAGVNGGTISGNDISGFGRGIGVYDGLSSLTITDNTISNGTTGIDIMPNLTGIKTGLVITNNTLTSNATGLKIGDDNTVKADTFTITGNSFLGNTTAGLANLNSTYSVTAVGNYWGSPDGPTITSNTFNVVSQGDAINGNVTYTPWLDAVGGSLFAPVENTTVGGVFYASIQAGIDDVSTLTNHQLQAEPGTYTEDVHADDQIDVDFKVGNSIIDGTLTTEAQCDITSSGSLRITGIVEVASNINTSTGLVFEDAVTADGAAQRFDAGVGTLDADGNIEKTTAGNLTLGGATITLAGDVTGTTAFAVIDTIKFEDAVTADGAAQRFDAGVGTLDADGTIEKTTAGNLTLGGATITLAGDVTGTTAFAAIDTIKFEDAVTADGAAQRFDAGVGTLDADGNIEKTTAGNLTLGGATITLAGDVTGTTAFAAIDTIKFEDAVTADGAAQRFDAGVGTLDADGNIEKTTAGNLTLGGATITLAGDVTGTTAFAAIDTIKFEDAVTADGAAQRFDAGVGTLDADGNIEKTTAGNLTLGGATITLAGDVTGTTAFAAIDTIKFEDAVTADGAAQRFDAGVGTLDADGTIEKTTAGNLTLGGATITLAGDVTGTTAFAAIDTIKFEDAVTADGAAQRFDAGVGTLDADGNIEKTTAGNLTLGGATITLAGDVTGTTAFAAIDTIKFEDAVTADGAAQRFDAGVGTLDADGTIEKTTAGNLTLGGATITLAGDVTGTTAFAVIDTIKFEDAVTADGAAQRFDAGVGTLDADGNIEKTTAGNLTLGGATITLAGDVTGTTAFAAIDTIKFEDAVTADGAAQRFDAGVGTLDADGTIEKTTAGNLTLGGATITLAGDVTGTTAFAVIDTIKFEDAVTADGAAQRFDAGVGTLDADGNIEKTTAGNLTLGGATITLAGDVTGTTAFAAIDTIKFEDAVTADGAAQRFDAGVGTLDADGNIEKTTAGNLTLGGATITLAGDVTGTTAFAAIDTIKFEDAVTADGAAQRFDAGVGTLDADGNIEKTTAGNLTLGGATITLAGDVTGTTAFAAIDTIKFEDAVTADGAAQRFDAGVGTLDADGTIEKTTAGNLTLGGATITLAGDVTGTTAFAAIDTIKFEDAVTVDGAAQRFDAGVGTLDADGTIEKTTAGNLTLGGATITLAGDVTGTTAFAAIDTIKFEDAVTADGAAQRFDAGVGTLDADGNIEKTTAGNLTLGGATITLAGDVTGTTAFAAIDTIKFEDAVTADGAAQRFDAGVGTLDADGNIEKTTAGNLTLGGATSIDLEGTVDVQGGTLVLEDNTTVADTKELKASADITVAAAKTVTGEGDLILEAIAGGITEIGGDNKVQIKMAADDKTLTLNQNDSIDMTNFYVTNKSDVTDLSATDLIANSTGGSVSALSGDDNPADLWKSITATADSGITLTGIGSITANTLTSTNGNIGIKSGAAVALNGTVTTQNGGGVTVTAQGDVTTQQPITTEALSVTTNSNIEIHSNSGDLNINNNLTAKGGGVKLVADDGNIYLSGASLNIIGTSDGTTGVTLPAGSGKAAIVILSKLKDLNLGTNADLTAYGWYDDSLATGVDDRASVSFLPPPETDVTGERIDIAIYLGSFNHKLDPSDAGGNVTVNSTVSMPDYGTMVIDAHDTVEPFISNFTDSDPWNDITNSLEVVSRISQTLDDAADNKRLPHADEARSDIVPSWFGGEKYVLRGKDAVLAEVLGKIEPVPLVLPKPLAPEDQGQVQIERRDAELLGLGDKPELARAYPPSLNTDLNLDKAAQILYVLMPILRDSSRIATLDRIVVEIWQDVDQPIAPEQEAMIAQRMSGTPAEEWVAALTEYVNVMSTMVGRPKTESVLWVMQTYVIPQAEEGLLQDQTVAFLEAQID